MVTPSNISASPNSFEFTRRTGATLGVSKRMALWESLCLLLAARAWLVKFPLGSVVRVKSDNISALYMLAKGQARSAEMSIVAREIAFDQAKGIYEFTILSHVNTKLNKVADPLSRLHDPNPAEFSLEIFQGAIRVPIVIPSSFWRLPESKVNALQRFHPQPAVREAPKTLQPLVEGPVVLRALALDGGPVDKATERKENSNKPYQRWGLYQELSTKRRCAQSAKNISSKGGVPQPHKRLMRRA